MLLTQIAAGSEVEATVQDTVDTITGFNKFIQEKGPDLIAFGIRILMALLIFIICHKVINWIRKITRASMERANSDTGARQFVDSLLKYGLHILLFLAIINSLGVESASIAATVASAGVAVGLALQGSLSNLAGGMLILFLKTAMAMKERSKRSRSSTLSLPPLTTRRSLCRMEHLPT